MKVQNVRICPLTAGGELAAWRPGITLKHLVDEDEKMLYESLGMWNCASAQENRL